MHGEILVGTERFQKKHMYKEIFGVSTFYQTEGR